MYKKILKSSTMILLASILIVATAFADSSSVTIQYGEYLKSTRAIETSVGQTIHIAVQGQTYSQNLYYYVKGPSGAIITQGTVTGNELKAYGVSIGATEGAGGYRLYLDCNLGFGNCKATGTINH